MSSWHPGHEPGRQVVALGFALVLSAALLDLAIAGRVTWFFDVVFVATCAAMVKPDGLMVAATLNRTLKSFALAIVGAEYVLRWVPRGTHQWDKFVTPEELEGAFEDAGLNVIGERGVVYNPLADRWQLSSDMDVNYMLAGAKEQEEGARA